MALAAVARRFSIPALVLLPLTVLLPMTASYAPLDAWHPTAQRTVIIVAGAAAAVLAVWTYAGTHDAAQSVLAMNTLFGRQLEAVKRRPSTPPSSGDEGERELRELPPREPGPYAPSSHRWHLLPRAEQSPPPELPPSSIKYLHRVSERLRRAAAMHGLSLTAVQNTSLALHAHPPGTLAPTPGPRIALRLSDGALLVALHELDAAEACAKGWTHAVSHRFVRDRHEVELARLPADDAELAVVLEIVDAGVKYLRSRAAELLCNEILDLVF
ncbi:hypothetical protein AURDEDRAFT_154147 [Auricularia subglabra TFB-10046 SS5]|nr:hypothetical protein AURDEDRAFT_154147 [Auricularia subglabra TFB-10046 SS5]